ncbi:glycerophosphodiester phosphodiesterase family protein [Sphingomonas sp. AP4-R1]|uniref:glycerophosphodiester phosphodiesterase family protein n=1 Tax=Sphingomonas sp. AP4-R1 TaxID=2735134 RepID=UPI0014933BAA|nr:glycerophosphodiester phosphodiesterase family protein [Sphingomonas sp. AP4-R1]QJU59958.1 glycerophosphodiester phosphodiesterase family protein [Sphingomonas sp. AP4-R1]
MKHMLSALATMQVAVIGAAMAAAASPPAPRVVAHRGRTDLSEPENSLRTMRHSIAQGVTMVEMDLKPGRDGTLYLLHDEDLDRTTDGHGLLAALADADAARVHLKDGTGRVTDETLVSFDSVARWAAAEPRAHLMLDIKKTSPAAIIPIVRAHRLTDRVLVLTFDPAMARAAFAADPDWRVSVFVPDIDAFSTYRAMAGGHPMTAYIPTFAPASLFRAVHAAGVPIVTDAMMPVPTGTLDDHARKAGSGVYRDYLAGRPVDIFVSDRATHVLASR